MDSSPPPAPASACATLSLCCTATLCSPCEVAVDLAAEGRGLEEVGAATLFDMVTVRRSFDGLDRRTGQINVCKGAKSEGYNREEGEITGVLVNNHMSSLRVLVPSEGMRHGASARAERTGAGAILRGAAAGGRPPRARLTICEVCSPFGCLQSALNASLDGLIAKHRFNPDGQRCSASNNSKLERSSVSRDSSLHSRHEGGDNTVPSLLSLTAAKSPEILRDLAPPPPVRN